MFDDYEDENASGFFKGFEYVEDVDEDEAIHEQIEAFVRENPDWTLKELAERFKTTEATALHALKDAAGPAPTTVKSTRKPKSGGPERVVYVWRFPKHVSEYEEYLTARLANVLGNITKFAALIEEIEIYRDLGLLDGDTPLDAESVAQAVEALDRVRQRINTGMHHGGYFKNGQR